MKIFINLGLPKTSSTNLQTNFYPNLPKLNYLGRNYSGKNPQIFTLLNNFVEYRIDPGEEKKTVEEIIKNFNEYSINKKNILISSENWLLPYQKNTLKKKHEIISQWLKLKRLKKIMDKLNYEKKYFLIKRNPLEALPSLFVEIRERIIDIFGIKFGDLNYFLSKSAENNYKNENLNLFFNVYNINMIKEVLNPEDVKIFDYSILNTNTEDFLKEISEFLEIEFNRNFSNLINTKTRVTKREGKNYIINKRYEFLYFLKKIIPDKIYRILNRNKFLVPNVKKINIMSEMSYNKKLLYKPIEKFNLNQN